MTAMTDRDFRAQLAGFSLTTAEILYRLPDVALQERGMVRQAVEYLRRRQAEASELGAKVTIGHSGHWWSPHPADTQHAASKLNRDSCAMGCIVHTALLLAGRRRSFFAVACVTRRATTKQIRVGFREAMILAPLDGGRVHERT